ncbi:TonB-dependent receptor plug domain-containing protein [Brevundimonas subvibrioides]|uniref:TonB-dependent receptor n=1 Tax=Brevundimonas subvibrioides (strain ATCC 15264 / DSM 4735 / LMG 14903 / NBRC 16000 / CB 81) TaxID=633149 RepID=D9QKN7_BRESC|nr:TonB-dependent receptor [Brevundimonas subvibrioides]ADK99862.1 TonB-dependent receptor [Brevundimonas subvibrioides ATCC 15264]
MRKSILLLGAAFLPCILADVAVAQDAPQTPTSALAEVIVTGRPVFRNRTDDVVPTLSYDLEYFQRFEPLTVGDALRRVPSVTFLSDVLESDGVRLRGLDAGYTQILINGERVPGGGDDRSFFVDRIPAELIERVEVVRSSSANRSGDAVAGAINIVLRDAYTLDGGYIRGGAILFPDDEVGGTFGAVYGGQALGGRLLVGASVQDRRNPKDKYSQRFDRPGGTLDNTEVQTDVRSGTDYSFNADYQVDVGGGELSLSGVFVRTERLQDEDSIEYRGGREQNADLLTINDNNVDIETDNLSLRGRYEIDMLGGETRFKLGYASFDDHQSEFENEAEYLRDAIAFPDEDRFTADFEIRDLQDEEWSGALEHTRPLNETTEIEFGVQAVQKDRESITDLATRIRFTVPNTPAPRPVQPAFVFTQGTYAIEETRIDPYVMLSGETGALKWEAGLRYETTDTTIAGIDNDYAELLPSASLRYTLNDTDRLIVSAGRTIRRPKFNDLAPGTLEEERGDNDFRGNPLLEPETAWGADVGIERRLGLDGVVGLNVFYRDVTNLIEDVNTGLQGSGGAGTFIESIDNVGDGQVYGVEFDLSTSLTFAGMENTGVFLNASWLDSKVEDVLGERRFNDQSDYVVNVGFTHDIPTWQAAFGATYRKQGDAFGRVYAEEVTTSYGADLEVFLEKRLFDNAVVRLTAINLLDSAKDEVFDKFADQDDQIARNYDEYELETETAGPVVQLVMRLAF